MSTHRLEELAVAAARLVVDEGLDYAAAKRRAARELDRRGGGELPSDEAVEDQVREHIALFAADTQPAELLAMRELALRWMSRLADFRPHLGGAVWRGTATRRSIVRLDLFCDDPKAAEIALVNAGIDYDVAQADARHGREPVPVLVCGEHSPALGEIVTLHLALRDHDELRGALRPDARGRSWRGDADALRRLLEDAS